MTCLLSSLSTMKTTTRISRHTPYLSTNRCLVAITSAAGSQVVIQFGGKHEGRQNEAVAVDSFIAEKGWKAKGKRLTQYETEKVVLIEPPVLEDEDEDFDFEETTSEPQEDTPSDIPEDTEAGR